MMEQVNEKNAKRLAQDMCKIVFDNFPQEPGVKELGEILAAIKILEDVFLGMAKEKGVEVVSYKRGEVN